MDKNGVRLLLTEHLRVDVGFFVMSEIGLYIYYIYNIYIYTHTHTHIHTYKQNFL